MPRDLAIDLGTANTLVYEHGRGVIVNEPSVIALDVFSREVVDMGRDAFTAVARSRGELVAERPLRSGSITDFDVTQRMVALVLTRAGVGRYAFARPRVLVCVPSSISEVEKRAVEEASVGAGARGAFLIEQSMAAAIGAGLPVHEPVGSMIVDVGGGTTEAAMISLGGIVTLDSVKVGGYQMDEALQAFLRAECDLAIGERAAEELKIALGSADRLDRAHRDAKAQVHGRDLQTGLPRTVTVTAEQVRGALSDVVDQICAAVVRCVGEAPPDLAQDVLTNGICLTGGGSLLRGLDRRITRDTHVPVHQSPSPLESVVIGAGKALDSFEHLQDIFVPPQ